MAYNETIKTQLAHRSIREFTQEPLAPETIDTLLEVARWTASSTGQQRNSIIRVTDPELKKQIAQVCGQEYVGRAPELWIFVVDLYRNERIAREKGADTSAAGDGDKFVQGFTDSILAAQNVVVAAESMGLGTVYLGSIFNDAARMCSLLNLPRLTFPAVGLMIGVPNQEPQLKPRIPNEVRVFENGYHELDDYCAALKDYDEVMTTYYDLRDANRRVDCFTDQVVSRIVGVPARQRIMQTIVDQGFDLNLD